MAFFNNLSSRQLIGELMDDPSIDPVAHQRALAGLRRINRISGVVPSLWRKFKQWHGGINESQKAKPVKILDIASGGGDIAIGIKYCSLHDSIDVDVHGCDISPTAVRIASDHAAGRGLEVTFHQMDVIDHPIPKGYDVLVCGLFLHHLQNDQVLRLLSGMRESGTRMILISDLTRSLTGYLGAWWGTRILSRSPVVHVDGPLSVRAAFTISEMRVIADAAGLVGATIVPQWPARWILCWERP